jgi:hypothetical protein
MLPQEALEELKRREAATGIYRTRICAQPKTIATTEVSVSFPATAEAG